MGKKKEDTEKAEIKPVKNKFTIQQVVFSNLINTIFFRLKQKMNFGTKLSGNEAIINSKNNRKCTLLYFLFLQLYPFF